MNSLFQPDKILVSFNASVRITVHGNYIEYYIGEESGTIKKHLGKEFAGFEFLSENGSKYFISTIKSKIPEHYDAVFLIDEEYEKLTEKVLASSKKKVVAIKIPGPNDITDSWNEAFYYKKEIRDDQGKILKYGLRPPQIGALHAIQAHWSTSNKPALVVMPTGTGKTETMLCLTIAEKCQGLLVIVPSASLRTQIFKKFRSLGILKTAKFAIVCSKAKNPVVGFLQTGIKTKEDADQIFASNVIIATPQIIKGILNGDVEIKERFLKWCNLLVMDEAHHSQAKEWNKIKVEIESNNKPILLFTATPFRNDKKRLQGKIIYDYPLSLAQKDKYFKNIVFIPILEFNPILADQKIAQKAVEILRAQIKQGYDHILMARVDLMAKAEEVFEQIYKQYTEFNPVFIHSGIKGSDRKLILDKITTGFHKIIVCVDMLGEGFDLPQLKVCALHDLHKNITTSFQFFGRFTRESDLKLGHATIIANIADSKLKGTLKNLYRKDSDWDKIISYDNESLIGDVLEEENFFKNFSDAEIPSKIPLRNITPAMSTVVFKLYDSEIVWQPENYKSFFDETRYETVSVEHQEEKLLVVISKKVEPVRWGKIDDLLNCEYDLYIFYLNTAQKLLYINSTNNSTTHNRIAEAIVGKNIDLFNEADIYKCLDGIFQLELFNLGLKSTLDGPISFTMYAGNGIVGGLDELDNKTKLSSNLFGVGYENGEKITIGCSSKGRVWTKLVKTIPDFCGWCDALGTKLLDPTIDTKDIFKFIQKPERLTKLPEEKVPVSIKWSEELYFYSSIAMHKDLPLVDYKITLGDFSASSVKFSIESGSITSEYELTLADEPNNRGYNYVLVSGVPFKVEYRKETIEITELFYEFPPVIWFHDNSKMYNNIYFPFKGLITIFDVNKLLPYQWTGVDIKKESQKSIKRNDSIQYSIIQGLARDPDYKIIFDDDDANEASDIIAIKYWGNGDKRISIELYHCKFSSEVTSGARLKDLYEVCGQAQRSFHWKHNTVGLLEHMIRRQNSRTNQGRHTRYEVGGDDEMKIILNMITSGFCELVYSIFVVQPGISKRAVEKEKEHLKLLGATDLLLKKTGNEFYVITSE